MPQTHEAFTGYPGDRLKGCVANKFKFSLWVGLGNGNKINADGDRNMFSIRKYSVDEVSLVYFAN